MNRNAAKTFCRAWLCVLFLCSCSLIVFSQKKIAPLCSDEINKALLESDSADNADIAINVCNQYLKQTDELCQIEMYKLLGELYGMKEMPDMVKTSLQKAIQLSIKNKKNPETANLLLQLFSFYMKLADKETAKVYLDSSAQYISRYTLPVNHDVYLSSMANWYENENKFDSSIHYLKLAIRITEKRKDTLETHILLHNLGNIYKNMADFQNAVIYFLKSIRYKELTNDLVNMPGTLAMLAACYTSLKQYKTALYYLAKAKAICIETGHDDYLYYCYILLTQTYQQYNTGKDSTLLYADSAIYMARKSGNKTKLGNALSTKADIMFLNNINLSEAEKLNKEAIDIWKQSGENDYLIYSLHSLGRHYFAKRKMDEAEKYLMECFNLATKEQEKELLISLNKMLSEIFEEKGDYKKALYHHQQFYLYKDSVENGALKANLAELERKFSIEKKESEIKNLNREKNLQATSLKQAKSRQLFFITLSSLMLAFIMAGIWAYRRLRKNRNELTEKNIQLDQLNQLKNRLFSIIAHDVKGLSIPFQRASRVLGHHIQKGDYKKTEELAKHLQTNAENLSILLDNLLQWSLEQMNGYTPKPEMLQLKNEMSLITEAYQSHAKDKNINLLQDIPEALCLQTDKGAFHVVFRNLIANAIKYTENGSVEIKASQTNNSIMCTIKDTGTGIGPDVIENLFSVNEKKIRNGTAGERGSGLGLVLVKKFLEMNGGSINIASEEGKGSVFTIMLPLQKTA